MCLRGGCLHNYESAPNNQILCVDWLSEQQCTPWAWVGRGGRGLSNYGYTWVKGVLGSHEIKTSYRTKFTGVYIWICYECCQLSEQQRAPGGAGHTWVYRPRGTFGRRSGFT